METEPLEIAAFVESKLGCRPTRVARLDAFATNTVYEVDAGEQRFLLKASKRSDALRAEMWACARGAEAGCLAPAVLARGHLELTERGGHGTNRATSCGMSAFVMTRVPGEPIAPGHRALRDVGIALRRLHTLRMPGFGALAEARWDEHGGFALKRDTWLGFLRGICGDVREMATSYPVAVTLADLVAAAIDSHEGDLAAVEIGSLCHGDLKSTHVLVEDEQLAGIIDWGDAAVADPLWDLARFAHRADDASTAVLLEGYDPAAALTETLAWRLPLYGALWMMVDAVVDHRLGHRADAALQGALALLE